MPNSYHQLRATERCDASRYTAQSKAQPALPKKCAEWTTHTKQDEPSTKNRQYKRRTDKHTIQPDRQTMSDVLSLYNNSQQHTQIDRVVARRQTEKCRLGAGLGHGQRHSAALQGIETHRQRPSSKMGTRAVRRHNSYRGGEGLGSANKSQ